MTNSTNESPSSEKEKALPEKNELIFYRIQFRPEKQILTAGSRIQNLNKNEIVMVQTDHGPEPARIVSPAPKWPKETEVEQTSPHFIMRRVSRDEVSKYERLGEMEAKAFQLCESHIAKHKLDMSLVNVERYFNGSKVIFYFTAENRVDFRELVKDLVQEFRTRVEMRQIGVRHETKMVGGLGCCGRELCCSSFIRNFESVSIKMAKEQNLPLNPSKISGACNRLLCCLNYEFKTYKQLKKSMPKVGKRITKDGQNYKVRRHEVLKETIVVVNDQGEEFTLNKSEWESAKDVPKEKVPPKADKRQKK